MEHEEDSGARPSFLVLYANAAGPDRDWMHAAPPRRAGPLLDRWVLGELHALAADVTGALKEFATAAAGRRLRRPQITG